MTTTVYQRTFGNIATQPRYKRIIECFWHPGTQGNYLPYIDPHKHRFTLYQAHLSSPQLSRVKNNNYTEQSCGLCSDKGHTRSSCWLENIKEVDEAAECKIRIQESNRLAHHDRFILYYIGQTAKLAAEHCWSHHIQNGGSIGLVYLWNVDESTGHRTNIRVMVYKMDNTYRICRCTSCYKYFEKHIHQFPLKQQMRHNSSKQVETTDLQFMEDEEIREQLKTVEIKTDGNCPICMNEVLNVDKVVTKCGHMFCASCLFTNIGVSTNCPMCRESLVDYKPIHDKIRVLEAEIKIMREELNHRSRVLRRVQSMIQQNI
tara:strand:- start:2426 stop:3376 length:951 start_codon:yes stop_codon:yes gene_type:complete